MSSESRPIVLGTTIETYIETNIPQLYKHNFQLTVGRNFKKHIVTAQCPSAGTNDPLSPQRKVDKIQFPFAERARVRGKFDVCLFLNSTTFFLLV